MKNGLKKHIQEERLNSGEIIVAKYSEIERKQKITWMNYVNKPFMNAPGRQQG